MPCRSSALRAFAGSFRETALCYAFAMQPRRQQSASVAARVRTVSQVNAQARLIIEERLGAVWVRGELSNLRRYASGHWYFTLKDQRAQLRCVMFAGRNRFVRFAPQDGLEVIVRASLSLYEARGDFQAIIDHIEPAGEGALRAAYEQLKTRLAAEGLFAEERKRPLPAFPRHIAVISSRDGAALRDVLAVARRRFACARITCFYVAVQGFEAAGQIIAALDRADRMRRPPDVVVLTRGGGSLEDLAAFNLEAVARRIAAARIPVVSAIGHETDVTIADFVADRRAPTPSAAAEMVTPDGVELLARLARLEASLASRMAERLRWRDALLGGARRRLIHPGRALRQRLQRADELAERLAAAQRWRLGQARAALAHQRALFERAAPTLRVAAARERIERLRTRLIDAAALGRSRAAARVDALTRALRAVSPMATLERGYAIVARPDGSRWGKAVTSTGQVGAGDAVALHLADGTLQARVEGDD